jgi:hypothetical protein
MVQDSFERDEKPERERDIEMGNRNPNDKPDYGLKDFFEEVWYSVYNGNPSADLNFFPSTLLICSLAVVVVRLCRDNF